MPTYVVTDPNTGRKVRLTGDTPPTDEDLDEIFASIQQPAAEPAQPEQSQGMMQGIADVGLEAMAGINRGATGLVDFAASLPNAALQLAGVDAQIPSLTNALAPATAGNFMQPGPARDVVRQGSEIVPGGVAGGALMRGASQAAPAFSASGNAAAPLAQQSVLSGATQQLGASTLGQDALYSALSGGGSVLGREAGQAIGGDTGEQIGSFVGAIAAPAAVAAGAGMARNAAQQSDDIAQRIAAGETSRDLALYRIDPEKLAQGAAKAVKDTQAKEAIKQGFDDGVISAVKAASKDSKKKLLKMAIAAEMAKKDAVYGSYNRPADVAGDSLAERLKYVKRVNTAAGKQLDDVAKSLRGQAADFDTPSQSFYAQLDDMGVSVGENGQLNFRGSDIEGITGAEKIIKQVADRVNRTSSQDAYDMHRLKRFIDEQVSYGKTTEGLSGKAERALKGLRTSIDESLDKQFPEYDKVNTQYSDTIRAIDSFRDAAGTKVNLFGENSDKALGTVARRLLSNTQSRVNLIDSIKGLEDTSLKYGAKFDDDIMTQMLFADELDKLFGTQARTSLQGDVGKATRRGIETAAGQRSLTGLAIDAASAGVEKARGINEENAFKSIKELLKREIK